ncbi:MAG: M3 family metallopeptidase [Spongiibacteraceae bacterium]
MNAADNALLATGVLPDFSRITPSLVAPAIDTVLADNRHAIADLLALLQPRGEIAPSWSSLALQLEELDNRLDNAWAPVGHLNGVTNTPEWRDAYEQALPKLTAYSTELGQNRALFEAYQQAAESDEYARLDEARRKVIANALRDFRLSGVSLEGADKHRFGELRQRLAELTTTFSNRVLDATQGWRKHVTAVADLRGIPANAVLMYRQAAQSRDIEGYVITLDAPSYLPAMQYGEDRELRRELYTAYATRASDQGPNAGQWDNSQLMVDILNARQELARLLGFNDYAELSLATKMAGSCDEVLGFLHDLAAKAKPLAQREYAELKEFAAKELGLADLQAWDVPFASEKLRLARYALSQEELRPYFPAAKVIDGLFAVVDKLFGAQFVPASDLSVWHPDVQAFRLQRNGQTLALCYLDLYAREGKRGGAWMDNCRSRRLRADGTLQLPAAFLICNFTPPGATTPSLLTHDEVTTLFHEFGHGLHHMLTQVDTAPVAGINGVAWDAVELPSQFLENWCWEPDAVPLISSHYETGAPLPRDLLDKMLAAKNFQAGLFMMRQLEFSLFDFILHRRPQIEDAATVQAVLDSVRSEVAVYPQPAFNRFQHSFSHIFAGGYAAGYYSYKWAEVLSADAFAAFEEEGIFNRDTGRRFLHEILERGGAREPMDMFIAFRGRKPSVDALLRHTGVAAV